MVRLLYPIYISLTHSFEIYFFHLISKWLRRSRDEHIELLQQELTSLQEQLQQMESANYSSNDELNKIKDTHAQQLEQIRTELASQITHLQRDFDDTRAR